MNRQRITGALRRFSEILATGAPAATGAPTATRARAATRFLPTFLHVVLVLALLCTSAIEARACDETTMLDFIGSLEAPKGYDTVYYGVRVEPPRPITAMSVGEVLDWQRRTVRGGSVSSAAGRYQIIRPTLQGLVDNGVVSRGDTFSQTTQDRLGRHLLRETGYRAGDSSVATANRIAGVWAALPRIGGAGTGRSVYEGVAGNHALVGAKTYRGVLECRIAVADTKIEADAVRLGQHFGFAWDQFVEDLSLAADRAAKGLAAGAVSLLFILFAADLVLRGGRWALLSQKQTGAFAALTWRILSVLICLALINTAGPVIDFIADLAAQLAGEVEAGVPVGVDVSTAAGASAGPSFSMAEFAASKMALAFSLFEGMGSRSFPVQVLLAIVAVIIVTLAALQMGVVIYWYARLFLAAAAGIPVLGMGGLTQTMAAAIAWMFSLMASGMSLMVLLLVLAVTALLSWDVRSATDPTHAALILVFLEILALALLFLLPKTAGAIVGKSGQGAS